jgi:hypothetical protein
VNLAQRGALARCVDEHRCAFGSQHREDDVPRPASRRFDPPASRTGARGGPRLRRRPARLVVCAGAAIGGGQRHERHQSAGQLRSRHTDDCSPDLQRPALRPRWSRLVVGPGPGRVVRSTCAVVRSTCAADGSTCAVVRSTRVADGSTCAVVRSTRVGDRTTCAVVRSTCVADGSTCAVVRSTSVLDGSTCVVVRSTSVLDGSTCVVVRSTCVGDRSTSADAPSTSVADGSSCAGKRGSAQGRADWC